MSSETNKPSDAVKHCAECPVCKYTRKCKKRNIFYSFCRLLEKICPNCRAVNKELNRDFQKSGHF